MESHLIYTASDAIKHKTIWLKAALDTEWIYFGSVESIDKELIINTIDNHFGDDGLYVVLTRKESIQTDKKNIERSINSLLGLKSFFVWDTDFKKVMEFNEIGTMRRGELS